MKNDLLNKIIKPWGNMNTSRDVKISGIFFLALSLGFLITIINSLFNKVQSQINLILFIAFFFASFTFLLLNKCEKLKNPLLSTVLFNLTTVTIFMLFAEGTHDETVLALPASLLVVSLSYQKKSLIITLVFSIAIIWIIGLLEINKYIVNRYSYGTTYFQLIIQSFILIAIMLVVDTLVMDLKNYIEKLRTKSKELEDANAALENINFTKDKLFSIITHDLKSPWQGILGIANILDDSSSKLSEEERSDFIKRLHLSLTRQYDYLNELLLWGSLNKNTIKTEITRINLKDLLENSLNIFEEDLRKKNIYLKILGGDEVLAEVDTNLFSVVFRNLISNAIKFSFIGGNITISIKEENESILIDFIDSGIGIPKDQQELLFKVEKNISSRGTAGEVGTGLGLIICKEIIEKHNGKMKIQSSEGKGTLVRIELPK